MSDKSRKVTDFSAPEAQPFFFPGDEHGVLLIHGFTGSVSHMRLLGEHLREQGFTVQGINLPGHARSIEEMGKTGWQDWLNAAKSACAALQERCKYVSVAGLSMGGDLTLLLAEQMRLTACTPISAPMAVLNKAMPFAKVGSLFVKTTWWNEDEGRAEALDQRYDYGYSGFPTRCAADLSKLIKLARQDLHAITCPILVVQSHADATIAPESADVILAGVSSERKGVLWLEDVPHVCTISREHEHIARAVGKVLREAEAMSK